MKQSESPSDRQMSIVAAVIGALVGTAIFFGFSTDIAISLILGAPIGLLVGLIAYRAIPRIIRESRNSRTSQRNGTAAAKPTIEEHAKPDFRMKTKG